MAQYIHPELPKVIEVNVRQNSILIDGEPFPHMIAEDGVEAVSLGGMEGFAGIRVTLLAQKVTFTAGEVVEGTFVIQDEVAR